MGQVVEVDWNTGHGSVNPVLFRMCMRAGLLPPCTICLCSFYVRH